MADLLLEFCETKAKAAKEFLVEREIISGDSPPSTQPTEYCFKVVMLGDSAVGKTSVLNRLTDNYFAKAFTPTIGIDFKLQVFIFDNKRVRLQIWDTAGQEKFKSITTSYYRSADGVMFFYDTTDLKSFTNVETWINSVEECCNKQVVKMIIGNKCELFDDRKVEPDQGRELAYRHDAGFFEVSAQEGININEAFREMARLLKQQRDNAIAERRTASGADSTLLLDEANVGQKQCCKLF